MFNSNQAERLTNHKKKEKPKASQRCRKEDGFRRWRRASSVRRREAMSNSEECEERSNEACESA
jgi:hypothetical protein